MSKTIKLFVFLTLSSVLWSCNTGTDASSGLKPVKVELKKESTGYQLYCDGKPFYIKGAGFEGNDPSTISRFGGNAIRTWRTDDEHISGQQILDQAHKNGLMVCMGLEIGRERHGFDYNDTAAVRRQFDFVAGEVMKYKDHPALLAWGIGNELNLRYTNPKVWKAVNDIALMIHATDPNHPVTTMLAGAGEADIHQVVASCPALDFLCFQIYGDIVNLPAYINKSGYEGAYVVSEWGATGHWEVPGTAWGKPIEQTSHEKAIAYQSRYENVIAIDAFHCIGSFVFLWGQKQERTPTWYGMFLESGEKNESVDVMQYLWTGQWPANRSPQLQQLLMQGKTAYDDVYVQVGESIEASVLATDPDNDPVVYEWEIIPEVPEDQQSDGGDFEPRQKTVFKQQTTTGKIAIDVTLAEGAYRLFVYVKDGNNSAATANIPFYVRGGKDGKLSVK